ncbi:C40 family peptidase [Streptomyces uncialis]|uniref:C40 family peptidase n=1 Tax=Streptomyces uncialis TaxID=1048205 RepID=UPI0038151FE3
MSHTAHIPSHRKPRRSGSNKLRAGVAGGVLSTLAVAGASGSASAAAPVTETIEMPTLTSDLSAQVARSASATQLAAATYELQAQQEQLRAEQDQAAKKAAGQAKKDRAEAVRLAEAEKKAEERAAKAEAERRAETERASRTAERAPLTTTAAAPASTSTPQSDAPSTGASGSTGTSSPSTGSSSESTTAPASGNLGSVIAFLKAQVGDAYVMGGTGPNSWDCSGLVQAAFKEAGIDLPRTSQTQSTAGTQVGTSNLQVGDILYWGGAGSAYHTGVYIGNGQYLDAANPSKGVVIQDLSGYPADGAVRVL